jgi:hypothetical protein
LESAVDVRVAGGHDRERAGQQAEEVELSAEQLPGPQHHACQPVGGRRNEYVPKGFFNRS